MSKSAKAIWIMVALGAVALLLVAVTVALGPGRDPVVWLVRGAALLGYLSLFIAILASAYMRELYRILGRPFLWAHHVLSVSGLILLFLHPVGAAIDAASVAVFVPRFDSWRLFFTLGGRLAVYLIWIASAGALLRRTWRKSWRIIHMLNYIAFLLGTVHATLIGTDLSRPFLRLIPIAMALVVIWVFVRKRMGKRRVKA